MWTVDQIADEIEHNNLVMSGDLNLLFKVKPSDRVEAFWIVWVSVLNKLVQPKVKHNAKLRSIRR